MAESLQNLRGFDPRLPSVRIWNALIAQVEARTLTVRGDFGKSSTAFIHPFLTVAGLWDDMPQGLKFPAGRTWRVAIAPGCVNDELAAIAYQKTGDERGWVMPEGYEATPSAGGLVDRALLDKEEQPPFLVVETPETAAGNAQFSPVADASRLEFFRTEEMWAKQLFVCHVVLTADPAMARFYLPTVPVLQKRFRLYAGPRPPRALAEAGGWIAVARLWLTRDPSGDPQSDEILVQQLVFWGLGVRVALDAFTLPDPVVLPEFTALFQANLDQVYASAAEALFWTM